MRYLDLVGQLGDMDFSATALPTFGVGVLVHLIVVRKIEMEQYLRPMIAAFAVLAPLSIYKRSDLAQPSLAPPLASAVRVAIILGSFLAGLATSIVLYRAFCHPLRRFPGPFLARVTKFYGAWLASTKTMYYRDLAEMHDKYGDFVRTGPRELSIRRASAVEIIYGPRSKCTKSTWYDQGSTNDAKSSIHMTRDVALHRPLDQYLPHVIAKVDAFVDRIASASSTTPAPTPLDATEWAALLSFDIMGLVGLGRDFSGVSTGLHHPAIRAIRDHMRMLGILSHVPWFLNLLASVPGATAGYAPFFRFCAQQVDEKRERMLHHHTMPRDVSPTDIMTWLIAAFDDPADRAGVPSRAALDDDSRVVIIAGSETTATTLAAALYYAAKLPEQQRRLQAALDKVIGDEWTYEKAKGCVLLDHFISETLRLQPAVRTGAPRETPAEGIVVDGVRIPGRVNVIVGVQGIQTDARYWGDRAAEFMPERFGEGRKGELGPYVPFNIGPYQCPGKTLAMMSLRCSISRILQNFDIAFAPGEDGVGFEAGALDTFTSSLPPCRLVFTKRIRSRGRA